MTRYIARNNNINNEKIKGTSLEMQRKSKENLWTCKQHWSKTIGNARNIEGTWWRWWWWWPMGQEPRHPNAIVWMLYIFPMTTQDGHTLSSTITTHDELRWSSTMTTQDGHTLMSIDSENLRNRFKDIQKNAADNRSSLRLRRWHRATSFLTSPRSCSMPAQLRRFVVAGGIPP